MKNPVVVAAVASLFSLTSSLAFAQAVTSAASSSQQAPAPAVESSQENVRSGDGKSPDDWRFAATVYGWAVNLNGSATARGNTVDINASVFDLLQKSSSLIGFMGDFEANKGPFGFFVPMSSGRSSPSRHRAPPMPIQSRASSSASRPAPPTPSR